MFNVEKSWAVVTGASSGIGLQFAIELAKLGWNIVLVSNQEEELKKYAAEIASDFGVETKYIYTDLSKKNAAQTVFDSCIEIDVKVLINNAGIFSFCQLEDMEETKVELYLGLHVETFTKLCKLFAARMAYKKEGYILNISSLAAYMNMPGITMYQATKAYVKSFSKSMWYEMKDKGIGVTVVCPGGVNTSLYGLDSNLLKLGVNIGVLTSTEKLVRNSLKAMFKKRRQYIPGLINVIAIPFIKLLPCGVVLYIKRKLKKYEKA